MNFNFTSIHRTACVLGLALLTQCSLRDTVAESPTGSAMQFRLVRIEEATLGSLNVKNMRDPNDLSLEPRSQLIREYVSGNLPLHMRLVLEARDPGLTAATLSKLDYEVFLDEKLLGKAAAEPNVAMPAEGAPVEFPLSFDLNTRKLLGDDAMPALRNFAVGLADRRRKPMRIALRLRPTSVTVGGQSSQTNNYLQVAMDSVIAPKAQ